MRALLGILRDLNIVIVSRDLIDPGQEGLCFRTIARRIRMHHADVFPFQALGLVRGHNLHAVSGRGNLAEV